MKSIIDWLIKVEEMSYTTYEKAAGYFRDNKEFSALLIQLMKDEKTHHDILTRAAAGIMGRTELQPIMIKLPDDTRLQIENYFLSVDKNIETGSLTKEDMLDFIVTIEFSELNDIFSYVVNTIRHYNSEIIPLAAGMHQHTRQVERYIESHPESRKYLDRIKYIPNLWEENILVVEDEPDISNLLQAILNKEGTVETAANGREALQKVQGKYYAAIISDVNMPVMNGIDFYKKAIELYTTIKKRFLFFTGTFDYKIISYLNQNNLSYLLKPSPVKDIKDAVSKILAL